MVEAGHAAIQQRNAAQARCMRHALKLFEAGRTHEVAGKPILVLGHSMTAHSLIQRLRQHRPWYVNQPVRVPVDLTLPDLKILADAEARACLARIPAARAGRAEMVQLMGPG